MDYPLDDMCKGILPPGIMHAAVHISYPLCGAHGIMQFCRKEKNMERGNNVNILNQQIISKAINELSFCFDDFSFMFSKLCEIANEYSIRGSVIFVPDGPKPLIFAMSLAVIYLNKEGISCLHICRNDQCKTYINVEPTDTILGFSV